MQAEYVSFFIDLFDFEAKTPGEAKRFSCEGNSLAYGGWTFWLNSFRMGIGPL